MSFQHYRQVVQILDKMLHSSIFDRAPAHLTAGILVTGISDQVQGQGLQSSMTAHGPVLAYNQTELAGLIAVNDLPSNGSPYGASVNGYVGVSGTSTTNRPLSAIYHHPSSLQISNSRTQP